MAEQTQRQRGWFIYAGREYEFAARLFKGFIEEIRQLGQPEIPSLMFEEPAESSADFRYRGERYRLLLRSGADENGDATNRVDLTHLDPSSEKFVVVRSIKVMRRGPLSHGMTSAFVDDKLRNVSNEDAFLYLMDH